MTEFKKHILTIGLPVYNGEKFLKHRLDSILSQSFKNYNLIISDNASTDSTKEICLDYAKKDPRITYIRQEVNLGLWGNFHFLLQKAITKYFVWAAVDDIWHNDFLLKNIEVLNMDEKYICSISKIKSITVDDNELEKNPLDKKFRNIRKKILYSIRSYDTYPFVGNLEQKIKKMLKKTSYLTFYSIFRTDIIKKSWVNEHFVGLDAAICLNILKYGDAFVVNESLVQRYTEGFSTKGNLLLAKQFNKNKLGVIFPHYPLTFWFKRNFGLKLFYKKFGLFYFFKFR